MAKVVIDLSDLKNDLTQLHNEAFKGYSATSDNERRDILSRIVEQVKTIKSRLDTVKVEVK